MARWAVQKIEDVLAQVDDRAELLDVQAILHRMASTIGESSGGRVRLDARFSARSFRSTRPKMRSGMAVIRQYIRIESLERSLCFLYSSYWPMLRSDEEYFQRKYRIHNVDLRVPAVVVIRSSLNAIQTNG